ncbi:hypothetical protein BHF70_00855 [Anaerostipes sp. 494a]|nr:hypothetical protein BHF70_00855 [Anaerostipes sp. 494a]
MTTIKKLNKQSGVKAPFCIFNYKRVMKKNQMVIILLAFTMILEVLFLVSRNIIIVMGQMCITATMVILYVKGNKRKE